MTTVAEIVALVMKQNIGWHAVLMQRHDELIAEHERLLLVRLGLSLFSVRHHQIIGASRLMRKLDADIVDHNTRLLEHAQNNKGVQVI